MRSLLYGGTLGGRPGSETAITIEQVLGKSDKGVEVLLRRADQTLHAEAAASPEQANGAIGQSLLVELRFAAVLDWTVPPGESGREHGLFRDHQTPGAVRIVGNVHNVVQLDDGSSLLDAYVRTGPEFVAFESNDMPGHAPQLRDLVQVNVRGLCFYPTRT
jgi:hypothetical protein